MKKRKVEKDQNYSGIIEKTTNDYEKLSETQMEEVIGYEAVSE